MRVVVETLGLPTLAAVLGKRTEIDLPAGASLADLIGHVVSRFGPQARQGLLDAEGRLDLTIQILLNEEGFVPREELAARRLRDGDRVRLMLLVGGG